MKRRVILGLACGLCAVCLAGAGLLLGRVPPEDTAPAGDIPPAFFPGGENYVELQTGDECSACAAAYVMRQLGREVTSAELYPRIRRVLGFVSAGSVAALFREYGYQAEAFHGSVETVKRRLAAGASVIAFVSIPGDTHYVVIAGYDGEFLYLADSMAENANAEGGWYNRRVNAGELEGMWRTAVYPVENVYLVISP